MAVLQYAPNSRAEAIGVLSKLSRRTSNPISKTTPINALLLLQRTVGNRAAGRVLRAKLQMTSQGEKCQQQASRWAHRIATTSHAELQRQLEEQEQAMQRQPLAGSGTPLVQKPAEKVEAEQSRYRSSGAQVRFSDTVRATARALSLAEIALPMVQRQSDPLSDMSTFQSPGASGWRGAIWGCYRNNCARKHSGWDVHAPAGTECKAVVAGTTRHASQDAGYGDYITLTSSADPSKKYLYAHLSARERAGTVSEGDKIGETGATGNASSNRPHLHFTVMENGDKVDPDGKGFSKPTQVIERTGSTASVINYSDPEQCTPCA